ncbi:autotransporter assembly complex protein TamA [Pseudopontixanthobacter vadosimaris]|uniref:autotransporter assembly complex protein TamA n=1 Tax=Pseudopontixanthobacter vadosimaris TaxID=2726450 RepID=UPI0030B887A8
MSPRSGNRPAIPTAFHRLTLSTAIGALCVPAALHAQEGPDTLRLEDLIPDTAVANPQDWAVDARGESDLPPAITELPELAADSPLAEMPLITVPWPDDDLDLPQLAPLEPEDDIEFATFDEPMLAPAPVLVERRIDDNLVIAYPERAEDFPPRDDFIERFAALSTLEELEGEETNIAQLTARARRDEELLGTLLRVYGYYDAQISRNIAAELPAAGRDDGSAPDDATRATVRFDIVPGPRYRFGAIDLGNLSAAPDYSELRGAFDIDRGMDLSSDRIVEEQADLDHALGENGYVFAEIDAPELVVDHERLEGDLTMVVRPGGKYAFGGVVSSDPGFLGGEHLAGIARFDSGDIYRRSLELDLRRAITATGLVSTATITPRVVAEPQGDRPGVVALDVNITRAPLRTIAGAIGYGSEEGIRVQASWEHRNLFPPEGSLRVRGILGTQEQLAGVTFRKNNFGGRDKVLTLDAYASTLDSDAYDARTVALIGTYERLSTLLFQKPFSWGGGFELIATDEAPASVRESQTPRETYFIAALPGRAQIDTTDDLLDPTTGFRLGLRLSPEISRNRGTQSFYLRSQVDASYYRRMSDRVVLAGRAAVASIPGADLIDIAPSRRLYAGGGSSVRGYGFQQIGPRNAFGEPNGGRSLVELALEARIQTGIFDGALSVVPFVDAGTVSVGAVPTLDVLRVGAGVGLRYQTGFGPIRVDLGVPVNPGPDDNPFAVYVSLGQAF